MPRSPVDPAEGPERKRQEEPQEPPRKDQSTSELVQKYSKDGTSG